jgi:hypothetical protein
MAVQHAMLVITRATADVVRIPGQGDLVVDRGTGDQAARQWWIANLPAAAGQAEREEQDTAAWQQQLAGWEASTEVDFGKERLHDSGPRVEVARMRFPDGTQSVVPLDAAQDHMTQEFLARNPAPGTGAHYATWRQDVEVTALPTWTAQLHHAGSTAPAGPRSPAPNDGYPIDEVLTCLDNLAADGWHVIHAFEDRGPRQGPDITPAEPAVTTVRYLLTRTT